MLDPSGQDEYVAGHQHVLASQYMKDNLALDDLYRDRTIGSMRGKIPTRRDGHDRQPKYSLLDQGAGTPPVSRDQRRVDRPFVFGEVVDENIAIKGTVHW